MEFFSFRLYGYLIQKARPQDLLEYTIEGDSFEFFVVGRNVVDKYLSQDVDTNILIKKTLNLWEAMETVLIDLLQKEIESKVTSREQSTKALTTLAKDLEKLVSWMS